MSHGAAMPAPQPLVIHAAGHACLAWWHAPAPAVDARLAPELPRGWLPEGPLPLAVVLASSWGEEDMSSYDGQRALAIRLAEAGLGTLRFEWPDTGDSSADTGTASVADLLAAFAAAADQARALSGCDRLAFVGVRLGALLAAQAAAARDDVEALVGVLPVASGRVFVREQRLLGARLSAQSPAATPGAALDAGELPVLLGGFAQPVRQYEAMAALKWPAASGPGLREALLLVPPDAPGRVPAEALAAAGVSVREWAHAGLARLLAIAHQASLVPAAAEEIVRWLQRLAGPAGAPRRFAVATRLEAATGTVLALSAADARAWMHLRHAGVPVRERVVQIGTPGGLAPPCLVGVLTRRGHPEAVPAAAPRRGIVLLSSGRERRVGPHRLWVPFARHRAALGDVVLRLDVAGIGDSSPHARRDTELGPDLYDPRAVADVARALAWLRREHGVGECTVMGVCSGAFNAWRAALEGAGVDHAVMLNPVMFHVTPGMSLDPVDNAFGQIAIAAAAGRSLRDPERWRKLLTGRANVGVIAGAVAARARHALRLHLRDLARLLRWPLDNDLAAELADVVARGVRLDFVFSHGEPGPTLMREEAGRRGMRLVRDNRVKVCEVAHADHTFAGPVGRAELYARLDALLPPAPSMISPPSHAVSPRHASLHP